MDVVARVHRVVDVLAGRLPTAFPTPEDVEAEIVSIISAIDQEESRTGLGDILRADMGLEVPVDIVIAAYRRLFDLGVSDAHSWICYAYYLRLHGPMWDDVADDIIAQYEEAARRAGILDNATLGHHPVFYSD